MNKLGYYSIIALIFVFSCTPKATKYFNAGKKNFEQAEYQFSIENFQQALSKGAPANDCNYYIAEAYRRSNRMQESEPYYKKAIDGGTSEEDAYFYYGYALKSIGNYEGAASQFKNYINIGTNFDLINRAKAELKNLQVINDIISKKSYYKVFNIDKLNTEESEYSPVFFNDKLYFTSSRGADKMHAATNTGFTDVYEYIFDGTDRFSGQARRLPDVINTHDAHEASAIFTKDGKTMIFSRGNNGTKKGAQDVDLYTSSLQADGTWSEAVPLAINDPKAWDSCPAFSQDGTILYFASNRENGMGGVDIYKATKDASGQWGNVTNIGAPVNTKGGELFPYESPEGVFYFSSDGHPSLGSLDLFKTKKEDGKVVVENLGRPVNTSYDDFAIFYKDTITGYFSSNRPGGKGDDDIYEFQDESKFKFAHYIVDVTSLFKDSTEVLLENTVVKLVNEKGDTLITTTTDSLAKYKKEIEPGKYTLVGSKDGYLTQTVEFLVEKVPNSQLKVGDNDIVVPVRVVLNRKAVGYPEIVINNIFYDYDKATIRPDAALELNKIVELLKNNPDVKIELGSHTDARGSDKYNQVLSQRRAQSAVDYIISKGIAKDRIKAKGYGESKPIVQNATTDEDHQRNRRTSIRITEIGKSNVKIINTGEDKGIY